MPSPTSLFSQNEIIVKINPDTFCTGGSGHENHPSKSAPPTFG
jgi:hypothetical protein